MGVSLPTPTFAAFGGGPKDAVARVPTGSGVGQILGPEGRTLVLAPTSNLRKWAAARLGLGPAPPPGRRPPTDLSAVATAVGWARTRSAFEQRLLYERLMAPLVPLAARRDLKPPVFLHLDPAERFPRLTVRTGESGPGLYGPFRNPRAAEKARDALNRRFALRPCDLTFEPDPAWLVGLACLYAQVGSCSAPCLARIGEDDYRARAGLSAAHLALPALRGAEADVIPPAVASASGLAVVVDARRTDVVLYPVRGGRVLESAAAVGPRLEDALEVLAWPEEGGPAAPDDWPWLSAWMRAPKGRGTFVPIDDPSDRARLAAALRAALPKPFAAPAGGDNVGRSRGQG